MNSNVLRPSGIAALGDLPWGAHFCQFYGGREDLVDSLVPYFKAGLENNEQCLWVTSEPFGAEDARSMLRAAVPDLERRIAREQIEIIDHREWYMRAAGRTSEEVLHGWVERHDKALADGYSGLRLTGNTYWLERGDWADFMQYEAQVTSTFQGHNIIGLCSYCSNSCCGKDVIDVVRCHQFALVRELGEWQLIESAALKLAKAELRQLNFELEERVRQRTLELEHALHSRDQFLSIASHELKTPITSLQLYVDGLLRAYAREQVAPEQAVSRLGKAKDQCSRLEKLVNQLLDVSTAATGTMLMRKEELDLAELARSTAERFSEDLRRAGCRLTLDVAEPVIGTWDRMRLDQVITNLLANAAKHARGADIHMAVTARGETATLTVRDAGPGIAQADQTRIFERFYQGGGHTHWSGFGLGLWIVVQIVEAHGGSIELVSEPGRGASFAVSLPTTGVRASDGSARP